MSRMSALSLLSIALIVAACGRSFDSPPPVPVIESVDPLHGFAGDRVTITVQNPGAEGEQSFFFGSAKATVIASDSGIFTVEVPILSRGDKVPIQVSAGAGQTEYDDPDTQEKDLFTYDGHGHPLEQKVAQERTYRANPRAVFTAPGLPTSFFGYINSNTRQLGLAQENLPIHADTGLCSTPLSAAVSLSPEDASAVQFWISALKDDLSLDDPAPTQLLRTRLSFDAEQGTTALDRIEEVAIPIEDNFSPMFVKSYACPLGVCQGYRVAVSDVQRARIALFSPSSMDETPTRTLLDLGSGATSLCRAPAAPGIIIDMVHDRPSGDIYAAIGDSPEVWRIPTDGSPAERIWPADEGDINCNHVLAAIAINPSRNNQLSPLRLYLVYYGTPRLVALQRNLGTWSEQNSQLIDGIPFSAATGQFENEAGEVEDRLYVMTSNGLRGYDISTGPASEVLSLPDQVAIGWPQALSTDDKFGFLGSRRADTILWADEENDRLLTWQVGSELQIRQEIPLGNFSPSLARSPSQAYDYLSDPFSNAVRILERDSAAQVGQFGIEGNTLFGSSGLASIEAEQMDLLFIPRPSPIDEQNDPEHLRAAYNGLVVRRIDGDRALPDCAASLMSAESSEADVLSLFVDEDFYDRFFLLEKPTPRVVFLRHPRWDPDTPGEIWSRELNLRGAALEPGVVSATRGEGMEIQIGIKAMDLDPHSLTLALLPDRKQPESPALLIIDMQEKKSYSYEFSDLLHSQAVAVTIKKVVDSESNFVYFVYLAMGQLGEVRELILSKSGQVLENFVLSTGGRPSGMFFSPDLRRLYVTHLTHNMLSIIDVETPMSGMTLLTNLDVALFPYDVVFPPDGGQAILLHLYTGHQTVIE